MAARCVFAVFDFIGLTEGFLLLADEDQHVVLALFDNSFRTSWSALARTPGIL